MEDKRRDVGAQPAATSSAVAGADSTASELASSRRRAGAQKRKFAALSSTNASSTPSKRITRDKNLISHPPIYNHNGPLTRARQGGPTTLAAATAGGRGSNSAAGGRFDAMLDDGKVETVEEMNKASEEWEALEAAIEADFEAIRSRDSNVHVVPVHCGWFSWTKIHPLEEQTLPSFFNGNSQDRNPEMYMEIRNWIMEKFHANPNTQIELKDLSELEVGNLDARQEVMEFLDYWGLINFHPFLPVESTVTNAHGVNMTKADNDGAAEKDSLLNKLYRFQEIKSCSPATPKPNVTFPAMSSGLFPESAIAEEMVKPDGPSVEYHCNSCSADCSRKRYHCQKQADFDLCTDCFNNGKFGSDMSSSDFILMVPAEAAGVSGGKWTDQETLLLLEALELYKENWNEIAEHVATKTKAQCILHFVQMPIADSFLDCDDDVDVNPKETGDPATATSVTSVPKDAPETSESRTDVVEGQTHTSPMEISKSEDVSELKKPDTLKPEDEGKIKVDKEMSKSEVTNEANVGRETGKNIALKALREAFEAVGYYPTPEGPHSFTEVGNPVMALAAFLALLVGPDMANASAQSSLKSLSGNSSAMQLAARHCFILEDPPADKKEPTNSESIVAEMADQDTQKVDKPEDGSIKEGNSTSLVESNHGDKLIEDSVPEGIQPSASSNEKSSEEIHDATEPGNQVTPEKVEPDDLNEINNPELQIDNQSSIMEESNSVPSVVPPNSVKESKTGGSVSEPSPPVGVAKDDDVFSDSVPSEKNEAGQPVTSNSDAQPSQPSKVTKDVDMISGSILSKDNESEKPVTSSSKGDPSQPSGAPKGRDMVSDSLPTEMNEPQQTGSVIETGTTTGEDQVRDSKEEKHNCSEIKDDHYIKKIKRAAVAALSAAAVKAKLLASQEEEQIQQLAMTLIEKQLQKLEAKLAFFNELDNVTLRVREQLERSRQRLYHERALIIHSRLGSRGMPPSSLPANRIPPNFPNSVARPPPVGMTSPRPPISRPMGTQASTPTNPFVSPTMAGSSIRPSSQDNLSSVGTK